MIGWKKACVFLIVMLLSAGLAAGCGGRRQGPDGNQTEGRVQTEGSEKKLKVVTTLFPYYDFTRQIAGHKVELTMVVPAGMDSHSFEPTPADMRTIQEADILICNGGAMEQWVSQVTEALDTSHMTVVTMMEYVDVVEEEIVEGMEDEEHEHGHGEIHIDDLAGGNGYGQESSEHDSHEEHSHEEHSHGEEHEYDEHIWTSPVNAMKFTRVITDVLVQADPENGQLYEAGRDGYLEKLEEVHQMLLQVARDRKRNTIVVGDKFPFRYLAEEYGFEYRAAFSGCSTDTEPSARTIAYLIDKVREEGIPAVYYLELSSHRVSEIIGEETGAEPMLLHSCHNVTRKEFDAGVTYVDLMLQNVENLRKGLDE